MNRFCALFSQSEQPLTQPDRNILAGLLAVLTAVCHLTYAVWFWTKSPTNAPKTSLRLSGEAYLATYAPSGWGTDWEMDASVYNRSAVEILRTGVPRTRSGALFLHAPVYSYFLAACYHVGGFRLLAVAIPQAILSGLTACLAALAAYRLAPSRKATALLAAGCLVLIDIRLAKEVGYVQPTSVLLALAAAGFLAIANRPATPWAITGFVTAWVLGVFTQAAFLAVAGAGALWLAVGFLRHKQVRFLLGGAMLFGAVLVKVVISQSHFGGGQDDYLRMVDRGFLWLANNPCYENVRWWELSQLRMAPTHGSTQGWKISGEQERRFYEYLERGGDWRKAAQLWIRENPRHYARLCFVRLRTTLGPITGRMRPLNRFLTSGLWLLCFPLGFYMLWRYRAQPDTQLVWWVALAVFGLMTFVLADDSLRYRYPLDILLMIYAGTGYALVHAWWLQRRPSASPPTACDSKTSA